MSVRASGGSNTTITAVRGLSVGHATDEGARTGCTVILGPFRGAVDIRGLASGTRQLDALSPLHIAPRIDGFLLTGGSAYGLAAADGVIRWLEEQGRGFETGAGRVPIVPTAVIFDLGEGRPGRRPDAAMGRAACEAATVAPVPEGRIGAGAGASVGKVRGHEGAMAGGVGTFSVAFEGGTLGALVVVNAFGDVLDGEGRIIAGARDDEGEFLDSAAYLRERGTPAGFRARPADHTTLAVVATDFGLDRDGLQVVARQAMNAIVRRTSPANTPFDGDIVFTCSTGPDVRNEAATVLRVGLWAEWALARAIERAVADR